MTTGPYGGHIYEKKMTPCETNGPAEIIRIIQMHKINPEKFPLSIEQIEHLAALTILYMHARDEELRVSGNSKLKWSDVATDTQRFSEHGNNTVNEIINRKSI